MASARTKPPDLRFFSASSPWNTPIPRGAATHPHSVELIAANFPPKPGLQMNLDMWTVPVYFVDSRTPVYDVECRFGKAHGDRNSYIDEHGKEWIVPTAGGVVLKDVPIPDDALPDSSIALRPELNGDAHLCLVDVERGLEWDFCWMAKRGGKWVAGWGTVFSVRGNGVLPNYEGSARASGFPLTAGLIFKHEIESGNIEHPLVVALNLAGSAHVYPPASASDGFKPIGAPNWGLPEGALVQLDPDLDIIALSLEPSAEIIARALQKYGMFVCDNSADVVIYAEGFPFVEPDPWTGLLHNDTPTGIPVDRLRVLDWADRLFSEKEKPHDWDFFNEPASFPPLEGHDLHRVFQPLNRLRVRSGKKYPERRSVHER